MYGLLKMAGETLNRVLAPAKNQFVDLYRESLVCDVRQIGDVVPLWDPGVCDAFVMDWFRRIHAGRPTWQHRRQTQNGAKVTVLSREPVKWDKKVTRLKTLQSSGVNYGSDRRFGYTELPPPESPDRQTLLLENVDVSVSNAVQRGSDIVGAIQAARRASQDEHVFFALRLQLDGFGHMIGIHLRREAGEAIAGNIPSDALHLFDPNIGEFVVASSGNRSMFIGDLLKVYGTKLRRFSLAQVKVWWNKGASGQPYRYPDLVDDDDM